MIRCEQGGRELLPRVEPMWQALRDFHIDIAPRITGRLSDRTFADRSAELLAHPRLLVQIAAHEDAGDIGCCVCSLRDAGSAEIDLVWIHPDHRSAGVGTRMIGVASRWLTEAGAREVLLDVAPENPRAIRLYERLGFITDQIRMIQTLTH